MAIQHGRITFSVQDADGNRSSVVDYVQFDNATATLSAIAAYLSVEAQQLDDIIDGKIVACTFTIEHILPGTLKADAVVGSNVQETALLSFNIPRPGGGTYSQDIPAFAQAYFVGKTVNASATEVLDWTDRMTTPTGTLMSEDDSKAYLLGAFKSGKKTFRK